MVQHDRRAARILMICPPHPSHRQAFVALAAELRARGHHVAFLDGDGVRATPRAAPGGLHRPGRLRDEIAAGADRTARLCRVGPGALAAHSPDLILGDQTEPAAGLLARHLDIPMVSIACALAFDDEPGVPIPFLGWPPDRSERGIAQLQSARRVAQWVMRRHGRVIATTARAWNLGPMRDFADCLSPLMTLAQTAPGFDHPRPVTGGRVHHMGPFHAATADAFPADIRPDPSRALIYVSLGTLQGHRHRLLARIARAGRRAGAQVLVSLGGHPIGADCAIPADWVRSFVPQRAILSRAQVCVTHAGLNTVMECLERGVPMLALPLTSDQPGVAARIVRTGTGLRLSPAWSSEARICADLRRLLSDPAFGQRARAFATEAPHWRRAAGAADAIEDMLGQGRAHAAPADLSLRAAVPAARRS